MIELNIHSFFDTLTLDSFDTIFDCYSYVNNGTSTSSVGTICFDNRKGIKRDSREFQAFQMVQIFEIE